MQLVDLILNIIIAAIGLTSVAHLGSKNRKYVRRGFQFALLNQPFWLAYGILHNSFAIIALNIVYTIGFIRGYRNNTNRIKGEEDAAPHT